MCNDMHWSTRHRGPYQFLVSRSANNGKTASEWIKGATSADDIDAEAEALLTDTRDSIVSVQVWSQRDQQFVFSYNKEVLR